MIIYRYGVNYIDFILHIKPIWGKTCVLFALKSCLKRMMPKQCQFQDNRNWRLCLSFYFFSILHEQINTEQGLIYCSYLFFSILCLLAISTEHLALNVNFDVFQGNIDVFHGNIKTLRYHSNIFNTDSNGMCVPSMQCKKWL